MSSGRALIAIMLLAVQLSIGAEGEIYGTVYDAKTQQPVAGANVIALGTDHGSATALDGTFRFSTTAKFPLVLAVSHISYSPIEIELDSLYDVKIYLEPSTLTGEEVVVSMQRIRSAGDVTSAIEIIDIETFQQIGARDIGEVLRPLAAVRIDVSPFGRQEVSIRGSNANEVSVFLDGIRLNNAYTGIANLSSIDLSDIGQAEVIKGGNATLFGHGATGGALNLTSQNPTKTTASYGRSFGLSDENDNDLFFSGSARLGPLAAGGRFSGKSRLYDGRTLFTSLYTIGSIALYTNSGELVAKFNQLGNLISYQGGAVIQGDSTSLTSIYYRGSVRGSRNWEFSYGQRDWSITDDFFANLTEKASETNKTYRASKKILRGPIEAMIQIEGEDQTFDGDRLASDIRTNVTTSDLGVLSQKDVGTTVIGKWSGPIDHQTLKRIKFEGSLRRDYITIEHSQIHTETHLSGLIAPKIDSSYVEIDRQPRVVRLGASVEGQLDNGHFDFYFNQGSNQRIPTLGDLYRFQGASIRFQETPLLPESFNSIEVGINLSEVQLKNFSHPAQLGITLDIFQNRYVQKIAYMPVSDGPPVPFNRTTAQLRGYELTLNLSFWNNHLNAMAALQHLDLSDAFIFPNKPEDRAIYQISFEHPWLLIRYDYQVERNMFIVSYGGITTDSHRRESANLNIMLKAKYKRLKLSLSYKAANLNTDSADQRDIDTQSTIPVNFFDVNRRITTFRIEI